MAAEGCGVGVALPPRGGLRAPRAAHGARRLCRDRWGWSCWRPRPRSSRPPRSGSSASCRSSASPCCRCSSWRGCCAAWCCSTSLCVRRRLLRRCTAGTRPRAARRRGRGGGPADGGGSGLSLPHARRRISTRVSVGHRPRAPRLGDPPDGHRGGAPSRRDLVRGRVSRPPSCFRSSELRAIAADLLRGDGLAIQYGPTRGHAPLLEALAEEMARRSVAVGTAGAAGDDRLAAGARSGRARAGRTRATPCSWSCRRSRARFPRSPTRRRGWSACGSDARGPRPRRPRDA